MEPRITTLLGDSASLERTTLDPILLLPPPSIAPRKPLPVEPPPVGDGDGTRDRNGASRLLLPSSTSQKKTVASIIGVLNSETATHRELRPQSQRSTFPVSQLSGRLSDILVDPSLEHVAKRRKLDNVPVDTPSASAGIGNNPLTLPKPLQPPKKNTKRPRIPPLLQGLHQPPPLPPEGRLFPPIRGDVRGFGRDLNEAVTLRGPGGFEKSREDDVSGDLLPLGHVPVKRATLSEDKIQGAQAQSNYKEKHSHVDVQAIGGVTAEQTERTREARKRNKWSDQETKDLLQGVSRFGIGNWKRILQCSDFQFCGRTAVDLKDRFRTCCPGQGLKIRKPKSKAKKAAVMEVWKVLDGPHSSSNASQADSSQEGLPAEEIKSVPGLPRKTRTDTHKKTALELRAMGIDKPFFKNKRRERREFTDEDDEKLMKGYKRHGPVWHLIRSDSELGFHTRHPTDLRDRFRIKYPELYAKAGYKLKPKDEKMLRDKKDAESQASSTAEASRDDNMREENTGADTSQVTSSASANPVPAVTMSSHSNARLHPLPLPSMATFSPFDDDDDLMDVISEDGEGRVTLNRNIFEWADANPSQVITTTGSFNFSNTPVSAGDAGLSMFSGTDDLHINPLAVFKPPSATTYHTSTNTLPSALLAHSVVPASTNVIPSSLPQSGNTGLSKYAMDALLRTPNLPTIVYPPVPQASARGATHNLPPPSDLLSGLDHEFRLEPNNSTALMLEDTLNFNVNLAIPSSGGTYSSGITLAPSMNTWPSRGLPLDEPLGDRSLLHSSI